MKLFLIKLGKAWNVLKRDGLWRGGKRILEAFFSLFQTVEPGDVLFISNGVGDSARYRARHVAEELEFQGFRTAVTVQDNPFLVSYAEKFSVFIFHRVVYTKKVQRFVERLKELKKEIVFETDDLVYDPKYLQMMDYYKHMNVFEKKLYTHGLGGEILADPRVEVATVTTSYLAHKLREKGKRVYIVRNKLSKEDVAWAENILHSLQKESPVIRMGYLSGTPSHNKDFATITEALSSLLRANTNLRLVVAGPLDLESELNAYASQIERIPFLPRQEYFAAAAKLDINLAPLEIGNPFCESKSELKFIEAGLLSVPTVAAATQTYREAIRDGVDGFVASNNEEWKDKIERLIADQELRRRIGEAARLSVLTRYTTEKANEKEYYDYLRSKIKIQVG